MKECMYICVYTYVYIYMCVCVYIYTCILFNILFHYGLPWDIEYSALCDAADLVVYPFYV